MAASKERIELKGPLDVALPDGSTVTIRPGPYGKGISLVPRGAATGRANPRTGSGNGRGRPPRPSTLELRALLQKDAAGAGLKPAAHYIEWLVAKEPKVGRTTLQQTAYREIRAAGGAPRHNGRRKKAGKQEARGAGAGRKPNEATTLLRERLHKDREAGGFQEPAAYIRYLVDKANIGIKQARPIVYRELRAAKK